MIRPEDIAGYSPELRELLEFSCIYLGAADGKFSSKEQEWIDRHFGEGAADRLMAHTMNADGSFTFDRIMRIVRHSLTESEKHLVAREARVWLKNFIAADDLEPEEQIRLDEFYQWLEKVGLPKLPKAKLGGAPVAPPTVIPEDTKGYAPKKPDPKHDPSRKTSGKGIFRSKGKSNPTQQEDFDYEQKFFKARLSDPPAWVRAAKFREKFLAIKSRIGTNRGLTILTTLLVLGFYVGAWDWSQVESEGIAENKPWLDWSTRNGKYINTGGEWNEPGNLVFVWGFFPMILLYRYLLRLFEHIVEQQKRKYLLAPSSVTPGKFVKTNELSEPENETLKGFIRVLVFIFKYVCGAALCFWGMMLLVVHIGIIWDLFCLLVILGVLILVVSFLLITLKNVFLDDKSPRN